MEIALAALLAGTAFFATWAFTARNNERARAHRLAEELEALRKPSHVPSVDSDAAMVPPDQGRLDEGPPSAAPDVHPANREPVSAARAAVAQALVALEDGQRMRPKLEGSGAANLIDSLKQDARTYLAVSDRLETSLSDLVMRTATPRFTPQAPEAPPARGDGETPPERSEEELISDAGAAIEELSDPTSRMADDLGSVLRNAERIRTSAIQSVAALATVSRSADSLTPLASALSSLSNRINLLALNLAVMVSPGARDSGEFDKAGEELRGLFEETRRLSREVGSLSQRAAGAASSARETCEDLIAAATDGHARADRGLQELAHLEELTIHLKETLEETRRASRRADERRYRLAQELSTAEAAESASAGHFRDLHRDAERWVADLRDIATAFHDTRTSGEGTVCALLEACEQLVASGRSDAAAETRRFELLRQARLLLEDCTSVPDDSSAKPPLP